MTHYYFTALGKYLGYPDCCIKAFIKRYYKETPLTEQQEAVHGNRGFIPCPRCAETVTHNTIHTLITNRRHSTPFPNTNKKEFRLFRNQALKIHTWRKRMMDTTYRLHPWRDHDSCCKRNYLRDAYSKAL